MRFTIKHLRSCPTIVVVLLLLGIVACSSGCNPLKLIGPASSITFYIPLSGLFGSTAGQAGQAGMPSPSTYIPEDNGSSSMPPIVGLESDLTVGET